MDGVLHDRNGDQVVDAPLPALSGASMASLPLQKQSARPDLDDRDEVEMWKVGEHCKSVV